jgi:hypothetical protein
LLLRTAFGDNTPKSTRSLKVTARFGKSPRCPLKLSTQALSAVTQAPIFLICPVWSNTRLGTGGV